MPGGKLTKKDTPSYKKSMWDLIEEISQQQEQQKEQDLGGVEGDPFIEPGLLIPFGGLTKLQGAKKIIEPFRKSAGWKMLPGWDERSQLLLSLRSWLQTPKKVRDFIKDINYLKPPAEQGFYEGRKQVLNLTKSDINADETIHELIHGMQDYLLRKRGSSLEKINIASKGDRVRNLERFPAIRGSTAFLEQAGEKGKYIPMEFDLNPPISTRTDFYRELITDINDLMKVYGGK